MSPTRKARGAATEPRIRVTAEELKAHWFSTESASMIHDHSTQEIVVVMDDGTQYACTFAEHARLRATE